MIMMAVSSIHLIASAYKARNLTGLASFRRTAQTPHRHSPGLQSSESRGHLSERNSRGHLSERNHKVCAFHSVVGGQPGNRSLPCSELFCEELLTFLRLSGRFVRRSLLPFG